MSTGGEIEGLAEGLWQRLRDVVMAERRLEGFAFAPEAPAAAGAPARLAALAADDAALDALARDVTLRALAAAADSVGYRVLASLSGGPVALDELSRTLGLPPLAVSERVNALAQLGLAARDLASDVVAETVAGRWTVALVEVISRELAARCRVGLKALA